MTPQNRNQLMIELELDEDRRAKPYRCTGGKLSIGVGRNLDDRGLRECEIDYLFNNDVDEVEQELNEALPWWRDMTQVRQRVLANMCFNLGLPRLQGFRNTLAAMQAGDYDKAADGMRASKWAKQVGKRAERLIKMMLEG